MASDKLYRILIETCLIVCDNTLKESRYESSNEYKSADINKLESKLLERLESEHDMTLVSVGMGISCYLTEYSGRIFKYQGIMYSPDELSRLNRDVISRLLNLCEV